MTPKRARAVLIGSALLLLGTLGAWMTAGEPERRADLVDLAAQTSRSTIADEPSPSTQPPVVETAEVTDAAEATAGPGFPSRIQIPSLGLDAAVVSVGLEPDGSMELPGATEAGWYQYGSIPGSTLGSAVVAAHVDYNGRAGVFFDLRKVAAGDEVTILDAAGAAHRFTVQERFQVDKQVLPTDELFRTDGVPMLTLITCGGGFDTRDRSYADNIVVRAVPV